MGGAARFWRRGGNLPRPGLPPEGETGKGANPIPCCRRLFAAGFPLLLAPGHARPILLLSPAPPVLTTRPPCFPKSSFDAIDDGIAWSGGVPLIEPRADTLLGQCGGEEARGLSVRLVVTFMGPPASAERSGDLSHDAVMVGWPTPPTTNWISPVSAQIPWAFKEAKLVP